MSFFGAFFAGFTLLSKGISKAQYAIEDGELKKRSQRMGQDTYVDHNGILHDMKTGRAITYHTDPNTGHKLIQDAYTLNTIRDFTLEESLKRIKENKIIAKENGCEYYEVGKPIDVLPREVFKEYLNKYKWGIRVGTKEVNEKNKVVYSLNNMKYNGNSANHTKLYKKFGDDIAYYIKEQIDDLYIYTELKSGRAVGVDNKDKLEERGYDENEFINKINNIKEKYASDWYGDWPMAARL